MPTDSNEMPPHIGLMLQDGVPLNIGDEFRATVDSTDLRLEVKGHSGGPYAGLALYLPTAVMLFVASSYFGGIFSKFGEDHYSLVKKGALNLWKRVREVRMTAIGAESKVSDFQKYQLAYSIIGDIAPNVRFKLVLRLNLDDQISEDGIVAFLDLIRDLHMGTLEESTLNNIVKHRPVGGTVVVTYDPETRSLISV